jgi:putative chitinase
MTQILTPAQLRKMCVGPLSTKQTANMASFLTALNQFGPALELDDPVNLSHLLPQVLHESGSFTYDREIWGPTPAQKRYEGRKDLGNTQKGDGSKFRGYGPIQLTGRRNVTAFYKWALKLSAKIGVPAPPDFTKDPTKIVTDPWEGLSALWYWDEGNPDGESLNQYAKDNNILMVTKRINGGLNGFEDRLNYYGRVCLVLLGYGVSKAEIKRFQTDHPEAGKADGVIGDKTRMAMHKALSGTIPYREKIVEEVKVEVPVEVSKPVPVKVESLDKPWYKDMEGGKEIVTTIGAPAILGFFTDIEVTKLLILTGLLAAGGIAWYLIRRSKAKAQNAEVKRIEEINAS